MLFNVGCRLLSVHGSNQSFVSKPSHIKVWRRIFPDFQKDEIFMYGETSERPNRTQSCATVPVNLYLAKRYFPPKVTLYT